MEVNRIYKPKRFDNYTIVPNDIFRIKGISIGATGLYAYLFSHDSRKPITIKFICGHFKENYRAINARIKELEKYKLLKRVEVRNAGQFSGYNYFLTDLQNADCQNADLQKSKQNNNYNNISTNSIASKSIEHFIKLFPVKYQPKTESQKSKWIDVLDKIERIDNYDLRLVYKCCKELRADAFWSNNFLSLLKLRNKDKNDIKYIDRFMDKFSNQKPQSYYKIKDIESYVIYKDIDSEEEKLGAITKTKKLNEYNLKQILTDIEYAELFKYAKNGIH